MILNRNEFAVINNRLRSVVLRRFEARRLLALGGRLNGGRVLEVGCGPGFGVFAIREMFGATEVDAFDLDPRMVALARSRLGQAAERVRLWVGDAAAIAAADVSYDAVFDFGVIHHVPDWRRAVAELYRVLKPGARLYLEEVLSGFIDRRWARRLFDHPPEDRFNDGQLRQALQEAGFEIQAHREMWRAFTWVIARKPLAAP